MTPFNYLMIYTDGSCNVRSQLGGIGIYIEYKSSGGYLISQKSYGEGFSETTISRMELRAIIKALQLITIKTIPTIIVSDSQYCVNSINKQWVNKWESENYIDRINGDLWIKLQEERRKFTNLKFIHTRSHDKGINSYRYGNGQADELASYIKFKIYTVDTGDVRKKNTTNLDFDEKDLPF